MDLHRQFIEKGLSALEPEEVETLMSLLRKLADASDAAVKDPEISSVR